MLSIVGTELPAGKDLVPPGSFAFATVIDDQAAAVASGRSKRAQRAGRLELEVLQARLRRLDGHLVRGPVLAAPAHEAVDVHLVVACGDHAEDRAADVVGRIREVARAVERDAHACVRISVAVRELDGGRAGGGAEGPGRGRRLTSRTGVSSEAGEYATEVSFRYSAWVSSLVQLMRPLASRTQSVCETTV